MVRALQIISIASIIAAVIVLILSMIIGLRTDPEIEKRLKEPGAAEKFASAGGRPDKSENQSSPLVKQAADFSRYLNPPPPPTPVKPAESAGQAEPAPPAIVMPKFNLIGTSYYALHPELSLALIDEPGNGLHWVREGNSVGHLKIEKVKDGSITVSDGQRTSEMTVKVEELWRRLIKNGSADSPSNAGMTSQTEPGKIVSSAPTTGPAETAGQLRATARPGTIAAQRPRTNLRGVPPLPGPPSSSTPSPPPAAKTEPEVKLSPLEKEIQAKIEKLTAELDPTTSNEETGKKLDEIGELLNQLEKIRASHQPSHQK